jgi:hypothetical protein
MIHHQRIAKCDQLRARIVGGVGRIHPVMQLDFDFSPAAMTVFGKALNQPSIVLLGGIKISMNKRPPLMVAPQIDRARILRAPLFYPALLLKVGCACSPVFGHDGGLEMIC